MSQPLADAIGAAPEQHAMRIGVVVGLNPPTVSIQHGDPVEVGVLQGVWLTEGRPVVVLRQGQTWLALGEPGGGMGPPLPNSEQWGQFGMSAISTTTSATYVLLSTPPTVQMIKWYEDSRILLQMHSTFFSSGGADSSPHWGVRVNGSLDVPVAALMQTNNSNGVRQAGGGSAVFSFPAGLLTMQAIWRRAAGTGTMNMDASDAWSCVATEIAP